MRPLRRRAGTGDDFGPVLELSPDAKVEAQNGGIRAGGRAEIVEPGATWADKAAALASYAKQADDKTLQSLSERIRARAISRCGELLRAIAAKPGANQNIRDGEGPKVLTRKEAARDAGLSDRERKTALRVANVPHDQFEALVEADEPASITELLLHGHMDADHRSPHSRVATPTRSSRERPMCGPGGRGGAAGRSPTGPRAARPGDHRPDHRHDVDAIHHRGRGATASALFVFYRLDAWLDGQFQEEESEGQIST